MNYLESYFSSMNLIAAGLAALFCLLVLLYAKFLIPKDEEDIFYNDISFLEWSKTGKWYSLLSG